MRSLLSFVREQWLPLPMEAKSSPPGAVSGPGSAGSGVRSSSAVDAVEAAMRVVLLGMCHGEDVEVLTRLVDQVGEGVATGDQQEGG